MVLAKRSTRNIVFTYYGVFVMQAPTLGPGSGLRPQGWGRGGAGGSNAAQDSTKTDKDKRPSRYAGREGDRVREREGEKERETTVCSSPLLQNQLQW